MMQLLLTDIVNDTSWICQHIEMRIRAGIDFVCYSCFSAYDAHSAGETDPRRHRPKAHRNYQKTVQPAFT